MRRRWALYRQQLRDITSQSDFPGNVLYPEIPK
ncbi:MAG: phage tail assembly chaperone [Eubacteriales bacterium]